MTDKTNMAAMAGCDEKSGHLPSCAPLAAAFVPKQQSAFPKYDTGEAIVRGTLFPGLDLPFKNIVNKDMPNVPMAELMALDFVLHELKLYLDVNKDDKEAFEVYQSFLKLEKEGRKRYVELYGPIAPGDMMGAEKFTWINNPWPWDYVERTGE